MGCATVGFVMTDKKPVFDILRAILNGLEASGVTSVNDPEIMWFAQYITIDFEHEVDGARMLSVHFDCDSDYEDTAVGKKVIVSLGVMGHGPEIIHNICARLTQFGYVYYTPNDCENEFELFGMKEDFENENQNVGTS